MTQELRLKTNAEPTIFNKEMVIGTLIFPIVGTFIGGWIGKNRMAREQREGRPVSATPSFWNKDTLLGGLLGSYLVMGVSFALDITGPVGQVLGAIVSLAGVVAGAYIGGKHGEKRMEREYEQARQQQVVQQISQNVSPEMAQAVEYRMAHDKQWAKQALEEKLLAAAQENVRQ